jgi:hypothetical protein
MEQLLAILGDELEDAEEGACLFHTRSFDQASAFVFNFCFY